MDQSIDPGKQVEKGSDITITVSMGTVTVPECDSDDLQLQGDDQSAGRYVQRIRRNNHCCMMTSGNVLGQWDKAITDDFSISKTGLLAKEGSSGDLMAGFKRTTRSTIRPRALYQFTPES